MEESSPLRMSPKYRQEQLLGEPQKMNSLFKKSTESSSTKDEEKGFTFSLNFFQKNSVTKKSTSEKAETVDRSLAEDQIQSNDIQKESKRKFIYASQSYQEEKQKQPQVITPQSNNSLFSMIFLNKELKVQEPIKEIPKNIEPTFSKQKSIASPAKPKEQSTDSEIKIDDFQVGKKLGSGKFGQVYLVRHKATGFFCAMKKIEKKNVDSKLIVQLLREIKIQIFLNHPNIVKMYSFFSDQNYIYLLMELCFSGQLYGFLKKKRRVPEDLTRNIVSQVCKALDYMHENEIIHRDLKPQNIIYQGGLLKICDFGWSISTNTMRGTFCGTPLYVSPELLKRKNYNNKIDVWSVGILTYELLFGKVPFEIQTEQDFIKIVEDQIKFSKVTKISDEGKDFILNCLEKDPRDRYTVSELLDHPFLSKLENVSMVEMY